MRLTVEIPDEEYVYLKMCCAKLNEKIKDFCGEAIVKKIHEWEDKWFFEENKEELEDLSDSGEWLTIEDLEKELGIHEMEDSSQSEKVSKNSPHKRRKKNYAQA